MLFPSRRLFMKSRTLPLLAITLLVITSPVMPRGAESQVQPPRQPGTPARAITTPKEHFGFDLGDDYCLANYQQLTAYWAKLESQSDRLKVVKIGVTEEGRPHLMGVVTSPANHKKLEHYRTIAGRLARAEGVTAAEAKKLAAEG